nr:hypothetical protein [Mycobacterium malmoense]
MSTSPGADENTSTSAPLPGTAAWMVERTDSVTPDTVARADAVTVWPAPTGFSSARRPKSVARARSRGNPAVLLTTPYVMSVARPTGSSSISSRPDLARRAAPAARAAAPRNRSCIGRPGGWGRAACCTTSGPRIEPPSGDASNRLIASSTMRMPSATAWCVRMIMALPSR